MQDIFISEIIIDTDGRSLQTTRPLKHHKQNALFPKCFLMSHSSEKKGSSSDTVPKRHSRSSIFPQEEKKKKKVVYFLRENGEDAPSL